MEADDTGNVQGEVTTTIVEEDEGVDTPPVIRSRRTRTGCTVTTQKDHPSPLSSRSMLPREKEQAH